MLIEWCDSWALTANAMESATWAEMFRKRELKSWSSLSFGVIRHALVSSGKQIFLAS